MCIKTTMIYFAIKNIKIKCVENDKYIIVLSNYLEYRIINTECVQF